MKSSNIGGQAVLEGIMMRNGSRYSVAVRKPDGEIEVCEKEYKSVFNSPFLTKTPFIRGAFNFIDSLVLGIGSLNFSAEFMEDEPNEKEKTPAKELTEEEKIKAEKKKERADKLMMGGTVILSFGLAIALFMLLPYFLSQFFQKLTDSYFLIALIEGILRMTIFIVYVGAISHMKEINRVYMYHGAEHKCINCIEHGLPLTVENVRRSSKEHKRCGTSFMLFVMVVSILLFMFIHVSSPILRVVLRLLLLPVIAGISYEFLKLAGRSENACVNALSRPGLWLQGLTTKEPDDSMIEVGIAAVERVFDWKAYLAENFDEQGRPVSQR